MRLSGHFKPFTFPTDIVAETLFANAMSEASSANEDFYMSLRGGLEFEFSDAVDVQNKGLWKNPNSYEGFFISSAIKTAFVESVFVLLSNECISPYAAYIIEDILRLAPKEILGWDILHPRVRAYLAADRNEIEHNTECAFDVIAKWLVVDEFARDKEADCSGICRGFSRRFAELKLKCIHDLEEPDQKEWLNDE